MSLHVSDAVTNPSFKQYVYHIPGDACNLVLVHYVRNHEVATASCHGNSKDMSNFTHT